MSHILYQKERERKDTDEPLVAEIFRFDPARDERPRMEKYVVPYHHRMSVFTILREIYEFQDSTLAFRNQQCGRGICGLCRLRVEINGNKERIEKSCTVPIKPGTHIVIRPYDERKLIRDLVVAN